MGGTTESITRVSFGDKYTIKLTRGIAPNIISNTLLEDRVGAYCQQKLLPMPWLQRPMSNSTSKDTESTGSGP
jgi:hypothetical protein